MHVNCFRYTRLKKLAIVGMSLRLFQLLVILRDLTQRRHYTGDVI